MLWKGWEGTPLAGLERVTSIPRTIAKEIFSKDHWKIGSGKDLGLVSGSMTPRPSALRAKGLPKCLTPLLPTSSYPKAITSKTLKIKRGLCICLGNCEISIRTELLSVGVSEVEEPLRGQRRTKVGRQRKVPIQKILSVHEDHRSLKTPGWRGHWRTNTCFHLS